MIVVTGMHRSGTSVTARLLLESGCDLGDPAGFHPGDRWNVDGYYEQRDVLAMNRWLTEGACGRAAYFWLPSAQKIEARGRRRATALQELADRYQQGVVKDTRFCLTLETWMHHGLAPQGVVVCLRHPLAVARSLHRRNWIPQWLALSLWQTHMDRLLAQLEHLTVRYVSYDRLFDPERVVDEFAPVARLAGASHSAEHLSQLARQCVQPGHRHYQVTEADARLPPAVARTWSEFCRRHEAQA